MAEPGTKGGGEDPASFGNARLQQVKDHFGDSVIDEGKRVRTDTGPPISMVWFASWRARR